jgi:hypothetical protein
LQHIVNREQEKTKKREHYYNKNIRLTFWKEFI